MTEQNKIKSEIKNEISDNVGNFTGASRIEDFLVNNYIENNKINYKKKKLFGKSILKFALEIGTAEYVNYLLREKSSEIEITQKDFDLAVKNGFYYIANRMKSLNNNINCNTSLSSKLSEENYKSGKDYFCEKEFELRKKIINLINENEIYNMVSNLGEKIQNTQSCSDYFKNEINGLISAYNSSESMSSVNKKKFMVKIIIKILISSEQEADINVIYEILGLDGNKKNNNDNEIRDLVKELKDLCSNNYNKIEKLFNDYVFKPVVVDEGDENSNSIGTVQSKMADTFKEDFNSYINRIENNDNKANSDKYATLFGMYLNSFIKDEDINSSQDIFWSESEMIQAALYNLESKRPFKINRGELSEEYGHFVIYFDDEYLDDSMGKGYEKNDRVQADNCCGVYAAHMLYIAETIYSLININGVVNNNEFKEIYKKFRKIYVENANKDGNRNEMKRINCKNRLCIAALNSLEMLEEYINEDKCNELKDRIKEEIKNSFITEEMKKEFRNLEDYAKKEKIKIEKEKISFKKKYIESFSSKISSDKENIDKTVEDIRKDYYKKKIDKINNLKKSINDTYKSGESFDKNNIEDLINRGEISNEKIIRSIFNKRIKKFSEELQKTVLPDARIGNKVYSGFGGKANCDGKTLIINYDDNGFFCDKLDSIEGIDGALKDNLKKGLKIELKDGFGSEKLIEIFSLLKTNPVLALIELKDISKKIYIGDLEILENEKNFNNSINVIGIISESRRLMVKLNNLKKVNNSNNDYVKIRNYICDILTKALIDNKVAKQITDLTEFKDINIITGQFLDLFKRIKNNDRNMVNRFNEEAVNMKNVLEKTNIPNEEKDKLMISSSVKCFNVFIEYKLSEMGKKINNIEKQLKEGNDEEINNIV